MKILLVANVAKEHVNKFHIPTIQMLMKYGNDVDVACRLDEPVRECSRSFDLPISRSPFHTNWIKGYRKLKHIIDIGNYDIVYCHTSVGATLARLASRHARKEGTKVIKFAHGTYFYKNAPWYNYLYFPLYKYLAYKTDAIITITNEDYRFSKRWFSTAKIFMVNGIGVDLNRFNVCISSQERLNLRYELEIPRDAHVMIYCAELIKNKNQQLLFETLKIIMRKIRNVFLVLSGIDHSGGKYRDLARRMGIESNVRFLGWRSDIVALYKMSDICVASSIREGFGLNIVEAMYCGLPVVASNNSGHNSIIKDGVNGFLVDIKDPQKFAERVLSLINDSNLKKRIINSSLESVNKYTSKEVLKSLYSIIMEVSGRNII